MRQYDMETQLSDLLTSYIQHFKSVLSTKLALLQSLCLNSNSLQANPQFLLTKFHSKHFQNHWPTDPQACLIVTDQTSTLTRFYLRIQEYLQYRLGPMAAVNQGVFSREIMNFQKELEKAVRKFQANMEDTKPIGQLFAVISQLQISFICQLIEKIKISKPTFLKGLLDLELIDEMKEFFDKKINKQQNQGLKPINVRGQAYAGRQNRLCLSSNFDVLKRKSSVRKKICSKHLNPAPNVLKIFSEPLNNRLEKSLWCEKETNFQQDEADQLQNYISQTQKQKINAAYSLLQLEETKKAIISKQDLLTQLLHKNLKNKMHISTYLNKYERKIRKRSVKQQSQKDSKSTAKSIKNCSPNYHQATTFLEKIQSFQIFTPITKNHSQSFKKRENNLQLPLIANRYNRRTTVQK